MKGTEYDACIVGYYNAKSLRNTGLRRRLNFYLLLLSKIEISFSLNATMSFPFSCSTAVKIFCLAVNAATIWTRDH